MKTYKQTEIFKQAPMTAAERQAKRKSKLLKDSKDKQEILDSMRNSIDFLHGRSGNPELFIKQIITLYEEFIPEDHK